MDVAEALTTVVLQVGLQDLGLLGLGLLALLLLLGEFLDNLLGELALLALVPAGKLFYIENKAKIFSVQWEYFNIGLIE